MSKELEVLLDLKEKHYRGYLTNDEYIEKINEVLSNYVNDYNNAEPSEALEHFNHFEKWYRKICYHIITSFELDKDLKIVKQALLKLQETEKVLKLIKEKGVDVGYLKTCKTLEEYNSNCWNDEEDFNKKLTQEEFNSIKEMI